MIKLFPVVEFYITNVCNLSCRGCNRFNDLNFKGHQYWDDHADAYEAWAKRLDIPRITILGGEPTLNPDLEKWCSNLRRLWPNSVIMVQSNGTYQREEHFDLWFKYRVGFGISLHNPDTANAIQEKWHKNGHPMAGFIEAYTFHQSSVIKQDNTWTLHKSNPQLAFNACDMKHDHTMYQGKLYKCPAMSNLPDFDSQFGLNLDERQRELLYKYQPLAYDCSEEELQQFVATKDTPIAQCEFCPQDLEWHTAIGEFKTGLKQPDFDKPVQEHELKFYK